MRSGSLVSSGRRVSVGVMNAPSFGDGVRTAKCPGLLQGRFSVGLGGGSCSLPLYVAASMVRKARVEWGEPLLHAAVTGKFVIVIAAKAAITIANLCRGQAHRHLPGDG